MLCVGHMSRIQYHSFRHLKNLHSSHYQCTIVRHMFFIQTENESFLSVKAYPSCFYYTPGQLAYKT